MNSRVNILYVSTLCSERLISNIAKSNLGRPNLAAQKFHRLLAQGMALNNKLFNLDVIGIPEYERDVNKNVIISTPSETEKDVRYSYVSIITIPFLKHLCLTFSLVVKIIKWRLSNANAKCYILFDILNLNPAIVSIFISKTCRIKSIAIVTDLPEFMYILKKEITLIDKLIYKLQYFLLQNTSGYIVLTDAINNAINKTDKTYCLIEGMADIRLLSVNMELPTAYIYKIIHYSGGLYEKFGVKAMIDAFMSIKGEAIKLHLFGSGDLKEYIQECSKIDPRIVFFGYVDNDIVLKHQVGSFVLVNPRFTHEDYTKYSFPSKTIEYMASGVPLLTTKLPGIPVEYLEYVYLFDNESINGYCNTLTDVLNKSKEEMNIFGSKAKEFVLINKNNKLQTEKIYYQFHKNL
jgi:glycosyltransferase involved in cell wall biosynthesis